MQSSVLDNQVEEGNRCPLRITLSFVPHEKETNNGHHVRRGASSHAEVAGSHLPVGLQHLRRHRNNHVMSVFGHCGTVVFWGFGGFRMFWGVLGFWGVWGFWGVLGFRGVLGFWGFMVLRLRGGG